MKTSIYAGLIAGTIDIGAACTINMVGPGPILRFIASGLLGAPLPHETWVYGLGLGLQWMMSIIIAAIFVIAANKIPALLRRWVAAGIAYGIVVYFVMTFVVVPLSRAKSGHVTMSSFVENLLAMILFGLIVAYIAHRMAPKAAAPA
ncbi:MAG TPA: hypothetical protein VE058_05920 [Steroidobacteraceae bacterium]|nr:hypothetical protein [Steroidobacteraceae bacterium]